MQEYAVKEKITLARIGKSIALSFDPKYSACEFGADYGERYYRDPLYRVDQDRKAALGFYARFGRYGMGTPDPKPDIGVSIQPLDFMNAAFGGRFVYNHDSTVWTPDKPLAHVVSNSDLEKLGDIDWKQHPLFLDLFNQVEKLREAFPEHQLEHVQGFHKDGCAGDHCLVVMHTPFTTAFRLVGERVMELMILEERLATELFVFIMRQYKALWDAISERTGWTSTKIHLGDCASSLLSPELYERLLLPQYQELMTCYKEASIHSCGSSTHLLRLFRQVPNVRQLQIGDGSDVNLARELFPDCAIVVYYNPSRLMHESPTEINANLAKMCEALDDNFLICCEGADPNTPMDNVTAFLEASLDMSRSNQTAETDLSNHRNVSAPL